MYPVRSPCGVYRRCQTTTPRIGGPLLSPRFLLIRLFDPHLHCIPSLHVLILGCTYLRVRRTCRRLGGNTRVPAVAWAYGSAVGVIEALADIGPSLFVLSELLPEYGPREARRLAGDLFRSSRSIGSCNANAPSARKPGSKTS